MTSTLNADGRVHVAPAAEEARAPTPLPAATSPAQPDEPEFDVAMALMRLLIGAALEGADELTALLRQWDATVRTAAPASARTVTAPDPLRLALIGMAFELPRRVRAGFSTMLRLSDEAANTVVDILSPVLQATPLDPVMEYLYGLYCDWSETVDHWTAVGQVEEQRARLMARQALPGVMDRVLEFATTNPEVRALVGQQGTAVAKSAVDEARERVGTADALAERMVLSFLRRPRPVAAPSSSPSPTSPAALPPEGKSTGSGTTTTTAASTATALNGTGHANGAS